MSFSDDYALWPDPYAAPDVPPRELLWQWLDDPAAVLDAYPDFEHHLESTPLGSLALSALSYTELPAETEEEQATGLAAMQDTLKRLGLKDGPAPAAPAAPSLRIEPKPAVGRLCHTRNIAEDFTAKQQSRERYTWDSMTVALLSGPELDPLAAVPTWRVVGVSPAELWEADMRSADDLLLQTQEGDEWVAHLWLEYRVAAEQLHRVVGPLAPESAELLQTRAPWPEGVPDEEEVQSPWLQQQRDRMRYRCRFLSLSLEARRAQAQHLSTLRTAVQPSRSITESAHLALAAADAVQVPVYFGSDTLEALIHRITSQTEMQQSCAATATLPPKPMPERPELAIGTWSLAGAPQWLRRPMTFYVVLRSSCQVLGGGVLQKGKEMWQAKLLASDWSAFADVAPEQFALLVPQWE